MFRTTRRVLLLLLSLSSVAAEGADHYDYLQNGADWPDDFDNCAGPN